MSTVTEFDVPAAPPDPADAAVDPKRWLALAVIAVAQLMVVLDASIVTIALPSAQHALHISTANRQWVVTAYTLAFGGLLLLGGRIADYVGRKRIFIIGLLGFAGASALGGVAVNAPMLFGARALQGAFAALLAPAALSLITVTFTEVKERATAFGVYGAISGGGAAIGLIMGGVLTEYASWRWCLLVNVPIAIMAAMAAVPIVRESQGPRQHQLRHPRRGHRHRRPGRPGLRLHQGRLRRLDGHHHPHLPGHRRGPAGRLRDHRGQAGQPAAAHAGRPRAQPGRLVPQLAAWSAPACWGCSSSSPTTSRGTWATRPSSPASPSSPSRPGSSWPPARSSKLLPRTGPRPLMAIGFGAAALGHAVADPDRRRTPPTSPTCCRPRS